MHVRAGSKWVCVCNSFSLILTAHMWCTSTNKASAVSHWGVLERWGPIRVGEHLSTCTRVSPNSHHGSTQTCARSIAAAHLHWPMKMDQAQKWGLGFGGCCCWTHPFCLPSCTMSSQTLWPVLYLSSGAHLSNIFKNSARAEVKVVELDGAHAGSNLHDVP